MKALSGLRALTLEGRNNLLHPRMSSLALTCLRARETLGPRRHLAHLPTTLRELELSNQDWGEGRRVLAMLRHIGRLTGLTRLALRGIDGDWLSGNQLQPLSSLTRLRELDLASGSADDLRSLQPLPASLTALTMYMSSATAHDAYLELVGTSPTSSHRFAPTLRRLSELTVHFTGTPSSAFPDRFQDVLPATVRYTQYRALIDSDIDSEDSDM